MNTVLIRSYYTQRPSRVTVGFFKPSLTQQQFKDECDINHIMQRYRDTGFLVDPLQKVTAKPQFGDFSTEADFMEAQNVIVRARENFEALPSHVRKEFGNDPARMLAFLEKESNYARAVELGLVEKRPDPPPTPPAQQVSAEGTAAI